MNYELYPNSPNDITHIQETVFTNRNYKPPESGIEHINSFKLLNNIDKAVEVFNRNKDGKIGIVADSDQDGNASASILYRYIKKNFKNTPICYLHTDKKHGLSDDLPVINNIDLLIIPDAGSNDTEQCLELYNKGIDIIILDHHIIEQDNPYAVVVNCTDGQYPNSELCGTGVTWQFLRALDDYYWNEDADNYLDMVAMATVADIMDVTQPENRTLIDCGLRKINHPLVYSLCDKANHTPNNITGYDMAFGEIPLVNAIIRFGTQEEKELLFKAFCCENDYFEYKKRGSDEVIEESIYDRAARLGANAKARQKNSKNKDLDMLINQVESKGLSANKVIVANGSKTPQSMTGILASALADKYHKPCLVLRKLNDNLYGGSGRNCNPSNVANFKELLEQTECFEFVQGHANAFGVKISRDNIKQMVSKCNQLISDDIPTSYVDFVIDADELDFELVTKFNRLVYPYVGEGFEVPLIVVRGIEVHGSGLKLMGKNKSMYKTDVCSDVSLVNFRTKDDDPVLDVFGRSDEEVELNANKSVVVDVVGSVGLNFFCGSVTAQFIVEDIIRSE